MSVSHFLYLYISLSMCLYIRVLDILAYGIQLVSTITPDPRGLYSYTASRQLLRSTASRQQVEESYRFLTVPISILSRCALPSRTLGLALISFHC